MYLDKSKILEAAGGEFAIYQRYLPGLTSEHLTNRKKNVSSCFSEDKTPSLSVYKRGDRLLFKCHSTGKQGNVFEFFALNEGINTEDFASILKAMNNTLNLGLHSTDVSPSKTEKWSAEYYPEFTPEALDYWAEFGVDSHMLTIYQVRQIAVLTYLGENGYSKFHFRDLGQIAFEYRVNGRFKLYVPKQKGVDKKYFIKTQTNEDIFGLDQLPNYKVEYLLVCEGEKDALCASAFDIPAVSFQSANMEVTVAQIRKLFDRACEVVICYDTDEAGKKAGWKLSRTHLLPNLELEEGYKDLAEYLPKRGVVALETAIDATVHNFKYVNNMLIVERHGLYRSIRKSEKGDWYELSVSNFTLEVDAFVSSTSESKRIIRLRDTATGKLTEPFSVNTDQFTSVDLFRKLLESKGNYFFSGATYDLLAIKKHTFRLAGMAEEVEYLGFHEHQGKACFILSNAVWIENRWYYPDKFGIVEGMQIPSAALENRSKDSFVKDRAIRYEPNEATRFTDWIKDLSECYGTFSAMLGFAFLFASLFFDHISHKRSAFPLLLVWGQKGSGKNSFVELLLALFGSTIKHDASLPNSTGNSLNKLHEQKANIPVWMDEYKNNIDVRMGVVDRLKGLFDLLGRSKAVDSSNRTKSSQIRTSTIVTGQEFPTDEALFSRFVMLEFQVRENSNEARERWTAAKARCTSGLGHLIPELLKYRPLIIKDFQPEFVRLSSLMTRKLNECGVKVNSRIIDNYACILAPLIIALKYGLKLFETQINAENECNDLVSMFCGAVELQARMEAKMDEVTTFWECFVNMSTGLKKRIFPNEDFVIKDGRLGFKPRVLDEFQRYQRDIGGKDLVNKDVVIRYMAKRNYFLKSPTDGKMYFNSKQERCYICNLEMMPSGIREDLINAFSFPVDKPGQ